MHEMLNKANGKAHKEKAGSPASILMKGGNKDCYAHGGSVMDTMRGMGAKMGNPDMLDTHHGASSTGAKALAAGGSGKARKGYPFT